MHWGIGLPHELHTQNSPNYFKEGNNIDKRCINHEFIRLTVQSCAYLDIQKVHISE